MQNGISKLLLSSVTVCAALLIGCKSAPYLIGLKNLPIEEVAPLVNQTVGGNVAFDRLHVGREIYVAKCVSCHTPIPISGYSSQEWRGKIIPRMSKKAELTPEETDDLTAYILAVCENADIAAKSTDLDGP